MPIRASFTRLVPMILVSAAPIVQAGSIYKCTQPDGSITLSDVACPRDTVTREYQGEATSARGSASSANDPYSIMAQVRGIEKREAAERKAAAKERRGGDKASRTSRSKQGAEPMMSYKEARAKALEATGYHDYETLSEAQRDRVDAEMGKYKHRSSTSEGKTTKPKANQKSKQAADPCADGGGASTASGQAGAGTATPCVRAEVKAAVDPKAGRSVPAK